MVYEGMKPESMFLNKFHHSNLMKTNYIASTGDTCVAWSSMIQTMEADENE